MKQGILPMFHLSSSLSSIITISTRLFWLQFCGESLGTAGLVSAYPAEVKRDSSNSFSSIRYRITLLARAPDNSQLEGYLKLDIGLLSVCPSTFTLFGISCSNEAILSKNGIPEVRISASAESNRILSCKTSTTPCSVLFAVITLFKLFSSKYASISSSKVLNESLLFSSFSVVSSLSVLSLNCVGVSNSFVFSPRSSMLVCSVGFSAGIAEG